MRRRLRSKKFEAALSKGEHRTSNFQHRKSRGQTNYRGIHGIRGKGNGMRTRWKAPYGHLPKQPSTCRGLEQSLTLGRSRLAEDRPPYQTRARRKKAEFRNPNMKRTGSFADPRLLRTVSPVER